MLGEACAKSHPKQKQKRKPAGVAPKQKQKSQTSDSKSRQRVAALSWSTVNPIPEEAGGGTKILSKNKNKNHKTIGGVRKSRKNNTKILMKTKQKSQSIRSVGFHRRSLQIESNLVVVEGLFTNMTLLLIGIAVLRAPTSPNDPSQSWHCLCGRPELQRQTLQCTSAGISEIRKFFKNRKFWILAHSLCTPKRYANTKINFARP